MAGLFIALCVIQGQSGDTEGMENSAWRKEKGRGTQYPAPFSRKMSKTKRQRERKNRTETELKRYF